MTPIATPTAISWSISDTQTHLVEPFSPQTFIDCSGDYENYGCSGGKVVNCYAYNIYWGVDTLSNYPYYGMQRPTPILVWFARNQPIPTDLSIYILRPCRATFGYFKIIGYMNILRLSNINLYRALSNKRVLAVSIDISGAKFYKSGVYSGPCTTTPNQNLVLVGAGTDSTSALDYWLLVNTWGAGWGENGRMRIARFKRDGFLEESSCGLNMYANFPYYAW